MNVAYSRDDDDAFKLVDLESEVSERYEGGDEGVRKRGKEVNEDERSNQVKHLDDPVIWIAGGINIPSLRSSSLQYRRGLCFFLAYVSFAACCYACEYREAY